jgi:hypothetical protein
MIDIDGLLNIELVQISARALLDIIYMVWLRAVYSSSIPGGMMGVFYLFKSFSTCLRGT